MRCLSRSLLGCGSFLSAIVAVSGVICRADTGSVPNPLEKYISAPDASFTWKRIGDKGGFANIEFTSQTWHGIPWRHQISVFGEPDTIPNAPALLFISGSSAKPEDFEFLKRVSERAHIVVALLSDVPNEPLFDGKSEDALLAYSFDQYTRTGDDSWPVLFPMVKSVMRAMDVITDFTHGTVKTFLVSGASKRGWTSYLVGAVDSRVVGIAPRVFEMINIRAQIDWAQKVYGAQSEKLQAYTDLALPARLASDRKLQELRAWIDPYEYRARLKMPKLLQLGTNDRYWVVDSARWYWDDLLAPKAMSQVPNHGHHLGPESLTLIAAWAEILAAGKEFPELSWDFVKTEAGVDIRVKNTVAPNASGLWKACAVTRDMREAPWRGSPITPGPDAKTVTVPIPVPKLGHCSYFVRENFATPSGLQFDLSTGIIVLPELPEAPVAEVRRHPKTAMPAGSTPSHPLVASPSQSATPAAR